MKHLNSNSHSEENSLMLVLRLNLEKIIGLIVLVRIAVKIKISFIEGAIKKYSTPILAAAINKVNLEDCNNPDSTPSFTV